MTTRSGQSTTKGPRRALFRSAAGLLLSISLANCSDDRAATSSGAAAGSISPGASTAALSTVTTSPPTQPTATNPQAAGAGAAAGPASWSATIGPPQTTLADIELPDGILAAVPYQDRKDPAAGRFQVKVVNGTTERIDVVGLQFVWDGFTTGFEPRDSTAITPQRRIDLPMPMPPVTCVGDGTAATMPDRSTARVRLALADGSEREIPVYDVFHVARRLYLADCERQMIERMVEVRWADVTPTTLAGRPASQAAVTIRRRDAARPVTVWMISNTINYSITVPRWTEGEPIVSLPEAVGSASAVVIITEGRCDSHALAESSQPFDFVVQIDIGDGVVRPLVLTPEEADRPGIRRRAEAACLQLGKIVTIEGNAVTTTAG